MPLIRSSQGTTTIDFAGTVEVRSGDGKKRDTHGSTFGVVYANDLAREALSKGGRTKFPVGSVIVREKLSRADATQPELVAVMIKRAPGFNPPGGDWEFLTADGKLTKLRERQKKGSCLECHSSQADRDFVFPPPAPK
ncbi:MAG TPA: cytochrome P460 family protein [Pyrinomonadaceae bacterium]|nr:cytochrome P460 family protein [Pyrinomonadaceae bacterium]